MILLLAGAAETSEIAGNLANSGFQVTVSTATDFPIEIGCSSNITRRIGPLSCQDMTLLCTELKALAIVDATHPYAEQVQENARASATHLGIPYFRYNRPSVIDQEPGIHITKSHSEAAMKAVSFRLPILLTSGTRNLEPYIDLAREYGIDLFVRALDCQASRDVLSRHGIPASHSEFGIGPFSVDENICLIRKFGIGTLVTKDGGKAGGLPAKLEAARHMKCEVVIVARPETGCESNYDEIQALINAVKTNLL